MLIPNMELIAGRVVNQSVPSPRIRMRVRVGVTYDCDVDLVRDTLLEVANTHPNVLEDPAPSVRLEGFGDSSLSFALLCWIPDAQLDDEVASDLRFSIIGAFRERGISIPFPQRDVHIVPDKPSIGDVPKPITPSLSSPE
jgi:small-conductance mechanosensitive channel